MSVVTIASGKGGTGKTTVSVNLAWILSSLRPFYQKTALVELDLDLSNAATLFGAQLPDDTVFLNDYIAGKVPPEDVALVLGNRLYVALGRPGSTSWFDVKDVTHKIRDLVNYLVTERDVKAVILDAPAGVRGLLLPSLVLADSVYLVTSPVPQEFSAALAAYKMYRRLSNETGVEITIKGWILNRVGAQTRELTPRYVEEKSSAPVVATIRYSREMSNAQISGVPYAYLKWGTDDPVLKDFIRAVEALFGLRINYRPSARAREKKPRLSFSTLKSLLRR